MSDLNDLNRPIPTDTEPDVLDTLRAHIIRAATWTFWGATANKVAGLMSAVTAAVAGGRSLRLYRRNDANTADEEVVSLPGVSVGGNAATATALETARSINGTSFNGTADIVTASWGAGRTITLGGTAKTVNGSTNVSWTLGELGAPSTTGAGASGTWGISVTGNAGTATTLATARLINGTSFNGSGNITTAIWGTGRTITIGSTAKTVDGSGNVSWTLSEIGAPSTTGGGASGTWSISITGSAGSAASVAWTGVTGRPTAVSSFTNDSGYITAAGVNSTTVASATAGVSAQAVGTYCLMAMAGPTVPVIGQTYAGADLRLAGVIAIISASSAPFNNTQAGSSTPSGTWRCMSASVSPAGGGGLSGLAYAYLFLRIS